MITSRSKVSSAFVAFVLLLSLSPISPATAAPKAGGACSKAGTTQTASNKTYTCVKKGKKLVWNSGVTEVLPSNYFNNVCNDDPLVPKEWAEYQTFASGTFRCARPYRFLDVRLPSDKPKSELTQASELASLEQCRLPAQNNFNNVGHRANAWKFNGDLQIQVIPIEFTDFKAAKNPTQEYGKYLTYIKDMFFKLSDGNTRINFKTPDKYINIGKSLQSYVIDGNLTKQENRFVWKKLDLPKYRNDTYAAADKIFDFTGIDMTVMLVPLSVPSQYIAHSPEFRMDNVSTNEGTVEFTYLMPPASAVDNMSWFGVEPFLHLHEFFHANGLLGDHGGNDFGKSGPDVGTGTWGHMSGMMTDFIVWDKWIAGMLRDSQVICAKADSTSTHWIKPQGYFGEYEKMLVIPLSSTKAIVVESQRAAGLNFKLPKISQGALIYTLDTTISTYDGGINVIRPTNRTGSIYGSNGVVLGDAPLKLNENITIQGHRITVIESGAFGDVVKVEKVG